MEETPKGFHRCPTCNALVSDERTELLKVLTCPKCTKQKKKPIGVFDYPDDFHQDKSGVGDLIILD